jgi:hypothetical protein
VDILLNGINA